MDKIATLRSIHLSAPDRETQSLTIRLDLSENGKTESTSALVSCDFLMALMMTLQGYQAKHKLPIPANFRPGGTPALSIVTDD